MLRQISEGTPSHSDQHLLDLFEILATTRQRAVQRDQEGRRDDVEVEAEIRRMTAIKEQILSLPARTYEGMAVKLKIAAGQSDLDALDPLLEQDAAILSLRADLERLFA